MDHAGTFLAADALEVGIISQHGIDQCSRGMPRGRVDDHSGRLIDHEQIVIFKDNIERDLLGNEICRHSWRNPNCHRGSAFEGLTSLLRRETVHIHVAICDQALDPRTRKLLQQPDQEFIKPLRSIFFKPEVQNAVTHLSLRLVFRPAGCPAGSYLSFSFSRPSPSSTRPKTTPTRRP